MAAQRASAGKSKSHALLGDLAYDQIKQEIIDCVLKPGSEVTESQLSERLKLGKAPIRAALTRLSQQGLVRPVHRRGYVIAPITIRDVNNIFQLRLFLEPPAARLAAQNGIEEEKLRRLDEICRTEYCVDDKQGTAGFLQANHEFHVTIARASGNERLARMIGQLLDDMERLFHFGLSLRDRSPQMQHEHRLLVDAIRRRDGEVAEGVAAEQIRAARDMVSQALMSSSELLDINLARKPAEEIWF
ncbi:MAG: GntR family transcriptional regulator [Proteobacteria bacterium]|nr:MAG: GntR family transcriptional regulator [Pseudomonadota bacterium]